MNIKTDIEHLLQLKKDDPRLFGHVMIWTERDDGLIEVKSQLNLIVREGRRTNVHFLGETTTPANQYIKQATGGVKFGIEGHNPGDTNTPVPPAETNTTLEDLTPQDLDFVGRTYLPPSILTSVLFQYRLLEANGNGAGSKIYTEAGLFKQDGLMYARTTFPGHLKDNTRRLYCEWTIL